MCDGVAVDADVMKQFMGEYRDDVAGPTRQLIERLCQSHGLVVDEGRKIEHEWLTTCQGPLFREWYLARVYEKSIKFVRATVQGNHRKTLFNDLGFPRKGYDLAYVAAANATRCRYIVAEDMDFFDPRFKQSDARAKRRAREDRCGAVCRYLLHQMEIRVGTVAHASVEL